jgi:hypothetical protein
MGSRRLFAAALSALVIGSGVALVAPGTASADGTTAVAATCSGLPLVGSTDATANVDATDDVDPVTVGGVVNNTLHVPIPEINVPVDVTIKKVVIKVPIPTGVTVNDVTFTPSSFTGQAWGVSGSVLTATFTGSVVIKNGGTPPVVPDVKMRTSVAGPARTVEWKVPTSIAADATWALGSFTATCEPKNLNQVLISTVVKAANAAPTANSQSVTTPYQTAKAITLSGTDPESSPLTYAVATGPAHGTLSGTAPNLTYTPANGYSGPDSFTFTANDGSLTSAPGTVSITVGAKPNTAPTATNQSVSVGYQTAKTITLTGADAESNPLTFAVATGPAHGTLSGTAPNLTYTPANGYSGPDSFTFTANDGSLTSAPGTVSITVGTPANTAPTATDQSLDVDHDTARAITLTGTDPESDPLTFAVATNPAHGTLSGTAPNLTYTPTSGYSGPDSFTFTASDGSLSDTGTISLTVAAAPATVPGAPSVNVDVVAEGEVLIAWSPPSSNGGSPITGYRITPYESGTAKPAIIVPIGNPNLNVTGLTNGKPHTFKVAAINAIGTGPDSAPTAVVTPQWWLPWSSGSVAINEIFTWMTGKTPTTAQRNSWISQMNAGKTPADLVVALRGATDATTNVDPTVRLYSAYLTRVPDAGGLNYWLNKRRSGQTLSRMSSSFAGSKEFIRRYGSMTNRQFVENIYANVLQRAGDPAGMKYWTAKLDAKKASRGQVMINFSESNEYKNKQVNNTHAAVIFIHLLGKTPTTPQRDAFALLLKNGSSLHDLVREQIHQPSFDLRAG